MTVDLPWPALIFMGTGTTAVRARLSPACLQHLHLLCTPAVSLLHLGACTRWTSVTTAA